MQTIIEHMARDSSGARATAPNRRARRAHAGASALESLPWPAFDALCEALGPRGTFRLRGVSRELKAQVEAQMRRALGPELSDHLARPASPPTRAERLLTATLRDGRLCWQIGMSGEPCVMPNAVDRAMRAEPCTARLQRQLEAAYPCRRGPRDMMQWRASWRAVRTHFHHWDDDLDRRLAAHARAYHLFVLLGGQLAQLQAALMDGLGALHKNRSLGAALRHAEALRAPHAHPELSLFCARLGWCAAPGVPVGMASCAPRDLLGQPGYAGEMLPANFEQTQPLIYGVREATCFAALSVMAYRPHMPSELLPLMVVVTCPQDRVDEPEALHWRMRVLPSHRAVWFGPDAETSDLWRIAPASLEAAGTLQASLEARLPPLASLAARQRAGLPYPPEAMRVSAVHAYVERLLDQQTLASVPAREDGTEMALELRHRLADASELARIARDGHSAYLRTMPSVGRPQDQHRLRAHGAWRPRAAAESVAR